MIGLEAFSTVGYLNEKGAAKTVALSVLISEHESPQHLCVQVQKDPSKLGREFNDDEAGNCY